MRGIKLRYGGRLIFENLTLEVCAGRFVALVGPSGVGKTSILKIAAGLLRPAAGDVAVGPVAYMGQTDLLFPWLSALGNVVSGAVLRGERPDRSRAMDLLARVGLGAFAGAYPSQLSGGMRQRVALARTLYEDRAVVLMDEPFSALDAVSRARMAALAGGLLKGRAVLMITHDPAEACGLADEVRVLSGAPARLSSPFSGGAEALMALLLEESKHVLF
jgi:putative hydroxymethylpyrimidine transport system ATP-binding protein